MGELLRAIGLKLRCDDTTIALLFMVINWANSWGFPRGARFCAKIWRLHANVLRRPRSSPLSPLNCVQLAGVQITCSNRREINLNFARIGSAPPSWHKPGHAFHGQRPVLIDFWADCGFFSATTCQRPCFFGNDSYFWRNIREARFNRVGWLFRPLNWSMQVWRVFFLAS